MKQIADWPQIFGHIITATGWSRAEVEALTLHEVNELLAYWNEHPPAHLLLAAMTRARPSRESKGAENDLASAVAGLGGRVASAPSREIKALLESQKSKAL